MFVLKKTNGKYLLLGKEKPKDGDICYNAEKDTIERFVDLSDAGVGQGAYLKVIATRESLIVPLGKNGNEGSLLALLRRDQLENLLGIEGIKDKASKWAVGDGLVGESNLGTNSALNKGFIAGYKTCQEESFTLEDMKICFETSRDKIKHPDWDYVFDDFDQFIKKFKDAKTTWLVEVELDTKIIPMETPLGTADFFVPKITDGYINITRIAVKHPFNV
jgi:hypothetical protein